MHSKNQWADLKFTPHRSYMGYLDELLGIDMFWSEKILIFIVYLQRLALITMYNVPWPNFFVENARYLFMFLLDFSAHHGPVSALGEGTIFEGCEVGCKVLWTVFCGLALIAWSLGSAIDRFSMYYTVNLERVLWGFLQITFLPFSNVLVRYFMLNKAGELDDTTAAEWTTPLSEAGVFFVVVLCCCVFGIGYARSSRQVQFTSALRHESYIRSRELEYLLQFSPTYRNERVWMISNYKLSGWWWTLARCAVDLVLLFFLATLSASVGITLACVTIGLVIVALLFVFDVYRCWSSKWLEIVANTAIFVYALLAVLQVNDVRNALLVDNVLAWVVLGIHLGSVILCIAMCVYFFIDGHTFKFRSTVADQRASAKWKKYFSPEAIRDQEEQRLLITMKADAKAAAGAGGSSDDMSSPYGGEEDEEGSDYEDVTDDELEDGPPSSSNRGGGGDGDRGDGGDDGDRTNPPSAAGDNDDNDSVGRRSNITTSTQQQKEGGDDARPVPMRRRRRRRRKKAATKQIASGSSFTDDMSSNTAGTGGGAGGGSTTEEPTATGGGLEEEDFIREMRRVDAIKLKEQMAEREAAIRERRDAPADTMDDDLRRHAHALQDRSIDIDSSSPHTWPMNMSIVNELMRKNATDHLIDYLRAARKLLDRISLLHNSPMLVPTDEIKTHISRLEKGVQHCKLERVTHHANLIHPLQPTYEELIEHLTYELRIFSAKSVTRGHNARKMIEVSRYLRMKMDQREVGLALLSPQMRRILLKMYALRVFVQLVFDHNEALLPKKYRAPRGAPGGGRGGPGGRGGGVDAAHWYDDSDEDNDDVDLRARLNQFEDPFAADNGDDAFGGGEGGDDLVEHFHRDEDDVGGEEDDANMTHNMQLAELLRERRAIGGGGGGGGGADDDGFEDKKNR